MLTQTVRRKFLKYFKENGHTVVPSSPVIPHDDPTLLFTNAGMNQFKDVFLCKSKRDYTRAATSQKCIRAGGKHNDLDNVGHTSRHLTFFEMLGNFSFCDYFKEEAIRLAWEVSTEVFAFDPDRLWPTVFREDDEAFELWTKYVPANRITRFDEEENFWAMGDVGPCGPCSELLLDKGPKYGKGSTPKEDPAGERFMEFWNLVFMQFNRDLKGNMDPLPKPSIDTGAGMERIVSLMIGVDNVFETDVLHSLIKEVEGFSGIQYDPQNHDLAPAYHVIADHFRTLAFAISDGAQPGNVDRGYVLRKVLRRAVRYGRTLGLEKPFLGKLTPCLISTMGEDYPELAANRTRIEEILTVEEESFLRTLQRGGNLMSQVVNHAKQHGRQISGDEAFKLKDTYGFPLEEILLIAKDAELTVDTPRFETLEKEAKELSRGAHKKAHQLASGNLFEDFATNQGETIFLGYETLESPASVQAIVVEDAFVNSLEAGQNGLILLDRSPFYSERGGQVGDTGILLSETAQFLVRDTQAPFKGLIAHIGELKQGRISVGDQITAKVTGERRQRIANNHTATHLLHWALCEVLGEHVKQAGSVVEASRLRFDFNHHKGLSQEEIDAIEDLVNDKIRSDIPVQAYELPYEEAQKRTDIKQFFGEKYDQVVRVIDADFCKELCGGTHTARTGTIGYFRIAKEGSIASGVRRIEAVTGPDAEAHARASEQQMCAMASKLKTQPQKLDERIDRLVEENRALAQELKELKKGQIAEQIASLLNQVTEVNQIPLLVAELPISMEELRDSAEELMKRLPSGVVVLGIRTDDKCHLIARVTQDLVAKHQLSAKEIIQQIAPIVEGSGGGKPNQAQAGGKNPAKLSEALAKARELIAS